MPPTSSIPPRHTLDTHINHFGRQLIAFTQKHDLCICNGRVHGDLEGQHTHRAYNTGADCVGGFSLVDYFISDKTLFSNINHMLVHPPLPESDHFILSMRLQLESPPPSSSPSTRAFKTSFTYEEDDIQEYRQALSEATESVLSHNSLNQMTAVQASDELSKCLVQTAHEFFKKATKTSTKHKVSVAWFDNECKLLRKCYQTAMKANEDNSVIQNAKKDYKIIIRKKKRAWTDRQGHKICQLAKSSPARFWQLFKSKNGEISIRDKMLWEAHFKNLLQDKNALESAPLPAVCGSALQDTLATCFGIRLNPSSVETTGMELNVPISSKEVHDAISKLRRNKACGIDDIKAEFILEGKQILLEPLTQLFNEIFTSQFPESWSVGIITPIFKKGDKNDCNNYRGVTVGTALSKLYAMILNKRLMEWTEKHKLRANAQAGFRSDHRCPDNVFILRTLIEQAKAHKKSLYCCFIDFSKAFDTIPRTKLWNRLQSLGIHGRMLQAIQSLYRNVQCCVNTPSGLTNTFASTMGVKQGCPLSPTMFGLYIDKLKNELLRIDCDAPSLMGTRVPAQFFADDSQLLSTSASGLQLSLNKMQQFCKSHGLKVNVAKTKILIYGKRGSHSWFYNNSQVDVVQQYKLLGLTLHSRKFFSKTCASALNQTAVGACHAMFSTVPVSWYLQAHDGVQSVWHSCEAH